MQPDAPSGSVDPDEEELGTAGRHAVGRHSHSGARRRAKRPGGRRRADEASTPRREASTGSGRTTTAVLERREDLAARPADAAVRPADAAVSWLARAALLIRPVRRWQLIVWECAALAAVFCWHLQAPTSIVAMAVAAVLVLATLLRIEGLCLAEWFVVAGRFWWRRRRPDVASSDPLNAALPDLQISAHYDRAGNRVGLARLQQSRWRRRTGSAGWAAVVSIGTSAGASHADLLAALHAAFDRPDIPLAAAQLVAWTVPGLDAATDPSSTLTSYWMAVRYEPALAPRAAKARGGGLVGAQRATATCGIALARDLAEAGLPSVVLDDVALRRQLAVAIGADALALAADEQADEGPEYSARESWRDWSVGLLDQSCYRAPMTGPALAALGTLAPGSAFTCWSVTLRRDASRSLRQEIAVRVGAARAPGGAASDEPSTGRARVPAVLPNPVIALDGRHALFLRTTLPLAAD